MTDDEFKVTPEFSILDKLKRDLVQTQTRRGRLLEEIRSICEQFAIEVQNKDLLQKIAWYVYWFITELPAVFAKKTFLDGPKQFHILAALDSGLPCPQCGSPTTVNSRRDREYRYHMLGRGVRWRCPGCETKEQERQKALAQTRSVSTSSPTIYIELPEPEVDPIEQLRRIPYTDYLLTDHWKQTRTRKLRSVGYRCQLCNTDEVSLHVHHRTYERRGCELDTDLTVLCEECHAKHHDKIPAND